MAYCAIYQYNGIADHLDIFTSRAFAAFLHGPDPFLVSRVSSNTQALLKTKLREPLSKQVKSPSHKETERFLMAVYPFRLRLSYRVSSSRKLHTLVVIPASIAGVQRIEEWILQKL